MKVALLGRYLSEGQWLVEALSVSMKELLK